MATRNVELILSDDEMSLLEEIVEFERDRLKKNPPEYFEAFGFDTVVNVLDVGRKCRIGKTLEIIAENGIVLVFLRHNIF